MYRIVLGLMLSWGALAQDPVEFAARQIGKPYRGDPSAVGPDAFDCSGLVKAAFDRAGVTLPHHAAAQAEFGRPVSGPFERGDLLFFDSKDSPGSVAHVGIVEGGVTMINAHSYFGAVRRDDYTEPYWGSHFLFARRLQGAPVRFSPQYARISAPAPRSRTLFSRVRFRVVKARHVHRRARHVRMARR